MRSVRPAFVTSPCFSSPTFPGSAAFQDRNPSQDSQTGERQPCGWTNSAPIGTSWPGGLSHNFKRMLFIGLHPNWCLPCFLSIHTCYTAKSGHSCGGCPQYCKYGNQETLSFAVVYQGSWFLCSISWASTGGFSATSGLMMDMRSGFFSSSSWQEVRGRHTSSLW